MSLEYDLLAVANCMNQLASPFALDKPSDFKAVTGLAKRTYYKMVEDGKASPRMLETLAASWSQHFEPMEAEDLLPVVVSSDTLTRIFDERKLRSDQIYREAERLCQEHFNEVVRGNWGASMQKSRGAKQFAKECLRPLEPLFENSSQVTLRRHELAALATVTETPAVLLAQGGVYRESYRWLHDEGLTKLYELLGSRFSPKTGVTETDVAGNAASSTMATCQAVCATAQLNNPATFGVAYEQLAWLFEQHTKRNQEGCGGWPYLMTTKGRMSSVGDPIIEAWALLATSLLLRQARDSFNRDCPQAAARPKKWIASTALLLVGSLQEPKGGFCRWLPASANTTDRSMSIVATLALATAVTSGALNAEDRKTVGKSVQKAVRWFGKRWTYSERHGGVYLGRLAQEVYLLAWLLDADQKQQLKGVLRKPERELLQATLQQGGVQLIARLSRQFPRFEENPATEQRHVAGGGAMVENTKHHALPWSFLALEFLQRTRKLASIPCEQRQLKRLKRLAVQRLHEAWLTGGVNEVIERDGIHPICETIYCFAEHG